MVQETPRLLIIDDDESYRLTLARALARRGHNARTAASTEEALTLCGQSPPSHIILDLNLGESSGLNLIPTLLEIAPESHILVLTGYASIQTTVSAIRLGARQYLPKPASTDEILKNLLGAEISLEIPKNSQLTVKHLEWEYIQRKLAENQGNIAATARALKMHRRTLQRKLAKKRPNSGDPDVE